MGSGALGLCHLMDIIGCLFISFCRYSRRRRRGSGFGFVDFGKFSHFLAATTTAAATSPHIGHQIYFNGLPAGLGRRKEEEKACHRSKDNAVAEEGQSKGRGPSVLESTHGTTSLLILTGLGLCSNSHLADAYRFQLVKHKYKISMF